MTWVPFLALPNYLGGKRWLCPQLFGHLARGFPASGWPGLTLLDPFAGACSVSLYAKAQGMRVIAGDIAERSHIVQQAVIANSTEHLDDHDLGLLFRKRNGHAHFVSSQFVPAHFPSAFAEFLDLALANVADHPSLAKQALLRLVLFKMMKAPRIQFSDTTISRAVEMDTIEALAGHKAKMAERWYLTAPEVVAKRVAYQINRAVFSNGHQNLAHCSDAQDLVEQYAAQAKILYIDPPYPGVTGYETYRVLDSVFAGKRLWPKRSPWSTPQFTLQLLNLLDVATNIPVWIISYGGAGVTLPQLLDLVEAYRPVEAHTIAYPHLQAIARPEVAQANREYLVIAKRP